MSEVRADFDTWFHEQEGVSLRSERFNGDVEWLKAAFDAGRPAQPSISTGQGEPAAWHVFDEGLGGYVLSHEARGPKSIPLYTHPSPDTGALREALKEVARLRLATDEGSLRERADRMWEVATAALPHNQGEGK